MSAPGESTLASPLECLPGAGPTRRDALAAIGIRTLGDLLLHLPRRIRERPRERTIDEVSAAVVASGALRAVICGTVRSARGGRRRSPARITVEDATGTIEALVFGMRQIPSALKRGNPIQLEGSVSVSKGRIVLFADRYAAHDEWRADGAPEPIYDLPDGVPPRTHARWIRHTLPLAVHFVDAIAAERLASHGLPPISRAIAIAHAPASSAEYDSARRRFAFDELRDFVAPLRARRQAIACFDKRRRIVADADALLASLPFAATSDQRAALAAILGDLARPAPMHRLLHGEVGSGKTCVALLALLAVVRAGHVGAMLAPTAVLAAQHAVAARSLFAPAGLRVVELTRDTPSAEARLVAETLRGGEPVLIVGTLRMLAVLSTVALAVIDEQQRFGVSQRARLRVDPATDLLVMTATPIPRTLALVAYGDLDLTAMRVLPAGRRAVATSIVVSQVEVAPFATIEAEVRAGGRVYVICPQIDGDSYRTVERVARRLQADSPRCAVAVAHGRLSDSQAMTALESFRSGAASILVATVLVEVGIDVPEATLIVILDAERFGLSQLHQLRGRVGRGNDPGRCLLVTSRTDPGVRARLEALVRAESGFEVAAADLELRGAGRVLGEEQHGSVELRHADLVRDADLLAAVVAPDPSAGERGLGAPDRGALVAYGPG